MTLKEVLKDIRMMNLIESREDCEIYEDDASGALFEIDKDNNSVVAVYELDEDFEVVAKLA